MRVRRGTIALKLRCADENGCPAMRLRFAGKVDGAKLSFTAKTPTLGSTAGSVKLRPPARALKALRRAGKRPVRLTVTGPVGFVKTTLTVRAG